MSALDDDYRIVNWQGDVVFDSEVEREQWRERRERRDGEPFTATTDCPDCGHLAVHWMNPPHMVWDLLAEEWRSEPPSPGLCGLRIQVGTTMNAYSELAPAIPNRMHRGYTRLCGADTESDYYRDEKWWIEIRYPMQWVGPFRTEHEAQQALPIVKRQQLKQRRLFGLKESVQAWVFREDNMKLEQPYISVAEVDI